MPSIKLPGHDVRDCLCCGDRRTPGGAHCICRETPDWYQNQHGEAACGLHRLEKFSVKSLAEIAREREVLRGG